MPSLKVLGLAALAVAHGVNAGLAHKYNGPGPRRFAPDVLELNFTTVAEKTVPFSLWGQEDADTQPPVWHWTTLIQQAPYPGAEAVNGTILNTKYTFTWNTTAKDKTLRHELLRGTRKFDPNQFCVTVIENTWSPANVRRYNFGSEEDARDGQSCMGPFQKKCLEYTVMAYKKRKPDANGCRGGNIDLGKRTRDEFPQCEVNWPNNFYHASTYNLLGKNTAEMSLPGSFPLKSGDGFAYASTDVYDLHDKRHFKMANDRVHAIIIQSGDYVLPLCMRVRDKDIYNFEGKPDQIISVDPAASRLQPMDPSSKANSKTSSTSTTSTSVATTIAATPSVAEQSSDPKILTKFPLTTTLQPAFETTQDGRTDKPIQMTPEETRQGITMHTGSGMTMSTTKWARKTKLPLYADQYTDVLG